MCSDNISFSPSQTLPPDIKYCHGLCRATDDSNALILLPKPKTTDDGVPGDAAVQRELSKSQKRKLKKVQEEKEKRANRAQVTICWLQVLI